MEAILREVKLLRTELSKDIVMLKEDVKDHEMRLRQLENSKRRWTVDWDAELKTEQCESMLTVYQDHIEELQKEIKEKEVHIKFLEQQLEYKTMGPPDTEPVDTQTFLTIGRAQL